METRTIRNLTLYFDPEEKAAAELVGSACARSLDLVHDLWGLEAPEECRVYVMTSWQRFMFHSTPWPWRIYMALTLPVRYARMQKVWGMVGGWTQRYGQRRVIGIKPPRLLQQVDAGLRERLFVRRQVDEWVQHNTCHELVHACTDNLQLPAWLQEGLAMVTVDHLAGKPTVNAETLATLASEIEQTRPQEGYGGFADPDQVLYLAARGYWITRYLAETRPVLLRELVARRQSLEALEGTLADHLGMGREEFWRQIDGLVVSHCSVVPETSPARPEVRS